MYVDGRSNPLRDTLWHGAVLGGIVNAVMTAEYWDYAASIQWEGNHYFLDGGDGRLGAVTFECGHKSNAGHVVGAFFFSESSYSPWVCKHSYSMDLFFEGCPPFQRRMAEDAVLPFLQMEDDGTVLPIVTSAFWDEGQRLVAATSWDQAILNGVNLIEKELIDDPERALAAWQADYEMSIEQLTLARALYLRKVEHPDIDILLSPDECGLLDKSANRPKGVATARPLFQSLGIVLP